MSDETHTQSPARPGPDTKTPIVKISSTLGIQRPGNTPTGREAPDGETLKR